MPIYPTGDAHLSDASATEKTIGSCQRAVDELRNHLTNLEDRLALVLESRPPTQTEDASAEPKVSAGTILADRLDDLKDRLYVTSSRLAALIDRVGL